MSSVFGTRNNEPAFVASAITNEDQAKAALTQYWRELGRICGTPKYIELEHPNYLAAVRRVAGGEDPQRVLRQMTGSCGL